MQGKCGKLLSSLLTDSKAHFKWGKKLNIQITILYSV